MKAPWSGQLSAAKTGWLVLLLFFGWLAYLLVPVPKPEPPPPPAPVKPPPSRLVAMGLPDNPDLEHLPEYFALYADKAEWNEDKAIFTYWNPGSNSYSYFFEATREDGSYRFRGISEPHDQRRWFDENLPENCPIRLYVHNPESDQMPATWVSRPDKGVHIGSRPSPLKSQISVEKIKPPPPALAQPSPILDTQKK